MSPQCLPRHLTLLSIRLQPFALPNNPPAPPPPHTHTLFFSKHPIYINSETRHHLPNWCNFFSHQHCTNFYFGERQHYHLISLFQCERRQRRIQKCMHGMDRWKRYETACNLCGLTDLPRFRQNEAQILLKKAIN